MYASCAYSASTQAEFYKAEAELLRFGDSLVHSPCAKYMKSTLLAIDAVFAIRMAHDVNLPIVALITAYDLTDWRYGGDTTRSVHARRPEFQFPPECLGVATEALHYMQTMDWVAENAREDTLVSIDTVLRLHEYLMNGRARDNRYHGFRTKELPNKKGSKPADIPSEVHELCRFINEDYFSPLGQASVIHHAFEGIAPFDEFVDRTGLVLAFMSMFKRGIFPHGYMVPICWGASVGKEYRQKLKDSSRDKSSRKEHEHYRECWAVYNAQNTLMSVVIAKSFLAAADRLRTLWRSQGIRIPSNSAIDRLLDLFLTTPGLSTIRASEVIGKSYSATSEAMSQLSRAGIVRELAIDGRERIFICEQSAAMITKFVDELIRASEKAERNRAI